MWPTRARRLELPPPCSPAAPPLGFWFDRRVDLSVRGAMRTTNADSALTVGRSDKAVVDLSRATFMEPVGLVTIAAVVDDAIHNGLEVQVIPPPAYSDCSKYLHRMGLQQALNDLGVECTLSPVRRHDTGYNIMELVRFDADPTEWEGFADRVFAILESHLGRAAAITLYESIAEIGINVAEHSNTDAGFLALQHYPQRGCLMFAVADAGVGLRASLGRRYEIDSDDQAVQLAARRGISGTGQAGRGLGIAAVIQRSDRGGSVTLWSGQAKGRSTSEMTLRVSACASSFPGTVVAVTLGLE